LLAKKRVIDKAHIVKALYDRHYQGEQDDKLIYYHIHSLRKRLKDIGLGLDAIEIDSGGYRLVPRVERIGEEL
jgi:DNA-binding winged helix-turn-helix (wHTH) protein